MEGTMRSTTFGHQLVISVVTAGCWIMLAACVQTQDTPYGTARIVSEPSGAKVVNLEDNEAIGTTPMEYTWKTDDGKAEYIQLVLTRQGYADTVTSFWVNPRYDSEKAAAENPQSITVPLDQTR